MCDDDCGAIANSAVDELHSSYVQNRGIDVSISDRKLQCLVGQSPSEYAVSPVVVFVDASAQRAKLAISMSIFCQSLATVYSCCARS